MPNADAGGRAIAARLTRFVADHANARVYGSLGQLRYLSALRHCAGVVGNSSSGLIEAPGFGVGTVNIGDRQTGRLKAASVIDCAPRREAIAAALERLRSPAFRQSLDDMTNPYGEGGATERVVDVLRDHPLDGLLMKRFHDMALPRAAGSAMES
jgi:UDP-N-acetylglucosamine 2-epimerase